MPHLSLATVTATARPDPQQPTTILGQRVGIYHRPLLLSFSSGSVVQGIRFRRREITHAKKIKCTSVSGGTTRTNTLRKHGTTLQRHSRIYADSVSVPVPLPHTLMILFVLAFPLLLISNLGAIIVALGVVNGCSQQRSSSCVALLNMDCTRQ